MLKRLFAILLLLPLTVIAVPTDIAVNKFAFDHDGLLTASYNVYCNGKLKLNIPGSTVRIIPITNVITVDGNHTCSIVAVSTKGGYESVRSERITFFILEGQPMMNVEVPAAPSNFRVIP